MSTRDATFVPPDGVGVPPVAATPPSASPGLALDGARFPGGPTLPDLEPHALAVLVGTLANELFAAPPLPVGAETSTPSALGGVPASPAGVTVPGVPAEAVPSSASPSAVPPSFASPTGVAPSVDAPSPTTATPSHSAAPSHAGAPVVADASPFSAPLQFAGLEVQAPFGDVLPRGLFALNDAGVRPDAAAPEHAAPYWVPEHAAPAPVATAIAVEPFEITPATDLGLRSGGPAVFDPHALRRQFPILEERVHGKRLVWLDNAATTQKPQVVIDRLSRFYSHENSNIHRAAHTLAARATDAYEAARESVRRFVNAPSVREIVFVRGATEGINLIAQTWGRRNVGPGDEIVITWLEHHANIVPWQQLCAEKGARLRVAPVDDRGAILLDEYEKLLGPKTRLVSLSQVSNALGTITPAQQMVELAHRHGAKVVVDGAQAVSHMHVDVQLLDCDFFVFSGHKVFAPTGIGAVFGKQAVLDAMPPWQGGGNMIQDVTFERTVYQPAPARFEAGTGNIADAVGLGTALDWLTQVGLDNVERYEHELLAYGTEQLATVPGLTIIGTAPAKAGVLSFVLAGQKTEEVGGLLDREGIAVRSGHHCAQPILRRFGLEATVRASLAPYNTCEDIDALVAALRRLQAGR